MRTSQQSFPPYFKSLGWRSVEFPAATVKFSHTFTPVTFQHGGSTERPHDVTPSRMVSANGKQPHLGDQWEAVFVCANQWKIVYAGTGLAYSMHTIASWQKILQNNSKKSCKNIYWPINFYGRTATNFGKKLPKKADIFFQLFLFV